MSNYYNVPKLFGAALDSDVRRSSYLYEVEVTEYSYEHTLSEPLNLMLAKLKAKLAYDWRTAC